MFIFWNLHAKSLAKPPREQQHARIRPKVVLPASRKHVLALTTKENLKAHESSSTTLGLELEAAMLHIFFIAKNR
jgi:hypothetical protein